MRSLSSLVQNLSLSSVGGSFGQPPFWSVPTLLGGGLLGDREEIENDFEGYAEGAYKANGIVFTCILIRQFVLSEARFQFQRLEQGRPGDLFGTPALGLLENPWPNGTTGELISRMEQDASLAGNFFATVTGTGNSRRIRRLRPDWVTIVTEAPDRPDGSPGQPWDVDAQVVGYIYTPRGHDHDGAVVLTPDQVVHWSPIPDPLAQWRGMSWISAVSRETQADNAASKHKLRFFENGAVSNLIISYDKDIARETVQAYAEQFKDAHEGTANAYKTIHLGGGADPKTVGADLRQLDFKVTQGAGESRIAAASLVGAVVAQFSEGMQGSALNAGNFGQARRRFAEVAARPLWRSMSAALSSIVDVPDDARLWYDDRDIPFLRQDAKEEAEIRSTDASTIAELTREGYTWRSAVEAVTSGDLRRLQHTEMFSVQLQPPGTTDRVTVPIRAAAPLLADGWKHVEDQPSLNGSS